MSFVSGQMLDQLQDDLIDKLNKLVDEIRELTMRVDELELELAAEQARRGGGE